MSGVSVRVFRYVIAGFQALLALFALMGFGVGLVAFLQLNLHPGTGVQRVVNVRNGGFILFELVAGAILGGWFARSAVKNFRVASQNSTKDAPGTPSECSAKIRGIGRQVVTLSGIALIAGVLGYIQTVPDTGDLVRFTHDIFAPLLICLGLWGLMTGIGLFKAWRWARISMLVFGGLIASACSLFAVPFFVVSADGSAWQSVLAIRIIGVLMFTLPAAVAIRSFSFFWSRDVKTYFRTSAKV